MATSHSELLTCDRPGCGAHYANTEQGWHEHRIVFGHAPGSEPPSEEGPAE